jgi:hypothetical protein
MNPLDIQKLLHSAWLFDDGQGQQTSDFLNGQTFELPTTPWVPPGWIPSDLYYKKVTSPGVIDVFFTNTSEEAAADDICKKITNNAYSECNDIPVSMKQISYSECMQVYSTTKDLASVNNVILNYGRMCQVSLDLPASPVLTLCDSMEVNTKENSGCPFHDCYMGYQSLLDIFLNKLSQCIHMYSYNYHLPVLLQIDTSFDIHCSL